MDEYIAFLCILHKKYKGGYVMFFRTDGEGSIKMEMDCGDMFNMPFDRTERNVLMESLFHAINQALDERIGKQNELDKKQQEVSKKLNDFDNYMQTYVKNAFDKMGQGAVLKEKPKEKPKFEMYGWVDSFNVYVDHDERAVVLALNKTGKVKIPIHDHEDIDRIHNTLTITNSESPNMPVFRVYWTS